MKSQLEGLLEAGDDLIGQVEDTKESLETDIETLNTAAGEIGNSIAELSRQADDLQRQIAAVRHGTPPVDPVAFSTLIAIGNIIAVLNDARVYLDDGNKLEALGTLVAFDDLAQDIYAAIRFLRMDRRPS